MMVNLVILILDVMEMSPDNAVGPLVREIAVILRKMPVWERKEEWRRLRSALRNRFQDKVTTVDLLQYLRDHLFDLEDKVR